MKKNELAAEVSEHF